MLWIGNGGLAQTLRPLFEQAGYATQGIIVRNVAAHQAAIKSNSLNTNSLVTRSLVDIQTKAALTLCQQATIYCFAVPDDAIQKCVQQLAPGLATDALRIHFSGSTPLEALALEDKPQAGVWYPLQTFAQPLSTVANVPVFIEATNLRAEKELIAMGEALGTSTHFLASTARAKLHLGAVLGSNFINHWLTHVHAYLNSQELSFDYLRPLLEQSIAQAFEKGPANTQTGPAQRQDQHTLSKHLKLLSKYPWLQKWYRAFSDSIREHTKNIKKT